MSSQRVTLDNSVFEGRLRNHDRSPSYQKRPIVVSKRKFVSDLLVVKPGAGDTLQTAPVATSTPKPAPKSLLPVSEIAKENLSPKAPDSIKQIRFEPAQVAQQPKRSKASVVMFSMAVVIFLFGMAAVANQLRTNKQVAAQAGHNSRASSEAPPDETKPSDQALANHSVAPDLPRLISIPKLNVQARVMRLGVKADGSLDAPANIYDVGWYENSSKPNEFGAMLLDGHVHGPTVPGVFANLSGLQKGDVITVERGDRKTFNYKVVTSKTYDKDKVDMAAALVPVVPGEKGLNLITCTGKIDYSTNDYQQRLIVFAIQM